jgi:hypothetical protein
VTPSTPRRVRRGPRLRHFVAATLASFVAVFGVLALRVSAGDDPALANMSTDASGTSATTISPSTTASPSDPYDSGTTSSDDSSSSGSTSSSSTGDDAVPSSTSGATTSAS